MRFWLHSSVRTPVFGPSVTLSFVAHVALIGAAMRGTAISAREMAETLSQRIVYQPPPDRRGGRERVAEHLQFIDVGGGVPVPAAGTGGVKAQGGPRPKPAPGGDSGVDRNSQDKSALEPVQDSVYSVLEVEERAVRTASSAAPVYPADLMKAGTEGGVAVRFVVDTTGHADASTIEIVRATNPLFAASVMAAVPQMVFTPAMVGGHRVRQAVEQNFEFRISQAPAPVADQTRTKPVP